MFGYLYIHFNRWEKISLKENMCPCNFVQVCFTGWSKLCIQIAAGKVSVPAASPLLGSSSPTPDLTLCALTRQQPAWKPLPGSSSQSCSNWGWPGLSVEVPLQVQYGSWQKQRHPKRGTSRYFSQPNACAAARRMNHPTAVLQCHPIYIGKFSD